MSSRDAQVEKQVTELFERVNRIEVHTDPYLETRVLARLREKRRTAKQILWRRFALAGTSVSAFSAIFFLVAQHRGFESFLVRPQTVKMGAFEPAQNPTPIVEKAPGAPPKAEQKPVKPASRKKGRKDR